MARLNINRLTPWRRAFQWLASLALLAIPFIRIDGRSLLRLDIPTLTLHLFGSSWHIEELYLFLLLSIALVLLFLLVTVVLGRVWCGWACPQTTLADLAEGLARRLGLRPKDGRLIGPAWKKWLVQGLFALLALLVGANLVWYFVSPYAFFPRLLGADLSLAVLVAWLATALVVYLDLALVRRLLCRDFCPYGRFQTALVDPGTLTLRFPTEETGRCLQCGACVRSCPMGIDIRRGFQVECINCGRCLDACRDVMARRHQPGIIRYSFGSEKRGRRALFSPRPVLLFLAFLAILAGLVASTVNRPHAAVKLRRSPAAAPQVLDDGQVATFFSAVVDNRSSDKVVLHLEARSPAGASVELRGPVAGLHLAANERRVVSFAVIAPAPQKQQRIEIHLLDANGRTLATGDIFLVPLPGGSHDRSAP